MYYTIIVGIISLFSSIYSFKKVIDKEDRVGLVYMLSVIIHAIARTLFIVILTYTVTFSYYRFSLERTVETLETYPLLQVNQLGDYAIRTTTADGHELFSYEVSIDGKIKRLTKKEIQNIIIDDTDVEGPRIERAVYRIPKNPWTTITGLNNVQVKITRQKLVVPTEEDIIEDYNQEKIKPIQP